MTLARKKFTEFKERDGAIADTELDDFWSTLARRPSTACSASGRAGSSSPVTR